MSYICKVSKMTKKKKEKEKTNFYGNLLTCMSGTA